MRVISSNHGLDLHYDNFNFKIEEIRNGGYITGVHIVAYSSYYNNKIILFTCGDIKTATKKLKDVALAYEKDVKVYFVD